MYDQVDLIFLKHPCEKGQKFLWNIHREAKRNVQLTLKNMQQKHSVNHKSFIWEKISHLAIPCFLSKSKP